MSKKLQLTILFFAGLALAGSHVHLGLKAVRQLAPTFDEPVHLAAGYVYLRKADYRFNEIQHPAFAKLWAALPLLATKPLLPLWPSRQLDQPWPTREQYQYADRFLYHNRMTEEDILEPSRSMQLILSLILGAALAAVLWSLGGFSAALIGLGFWAFSPTFLAHASLVSTDISYALFFFLFFASLEAFQGRVRDLMAGVALGLCFASKYFAISVFPALAMAFLWIHRTDLIRTRGRCLAEILFTGTAVRRGIIVGLVAFSVVMAVYRVSHIESFWTGLTSIVARSQAGRSSFFWGRHGHEGWLLYFPFAFLVKTETSLLAALVLALFLAMRRRLAVPALLWIPPLVYLTITCFSKVQIGHRYILAVYPFAIAVAALGLARLPLRPQALLSAILVIGLGFESWRAAPHFLSYFNPIGGGSANGYKYLTDSNVDWGQGLRLLKEELEEEDFEKGIYLCYFGTADPHYYGIRYLNIGGDDLSGHVDDSDAPGLKPTKLAISVTHLQGTYFAEHDVFSWLKAYQPKAVLAHSIFVYDFSNHPDVLQRLERLRTPLRKEA